MAPIDRETKKKNRETLFFFFSYVSWAAMARALAPTIGRVAFKTPSQRVRASVWIFSDSDTLGRLHPFAQHCRGYKNQRKNSIGRKKINRIATEKRGGGSHSTHINYMKRIYMKYRASGCSSGGAQLTKRAIQGKSGTRKIVELFFFFFFKFFCPEIPRH